MSTTGTSGLLDRENPWPGLLAFSEDAREFFNGREAERDELLRLIRREQLTLLYGHSGLGKTSLLNAGVFPQLRAENLLPISVRIDHRSASPPADDQMLARLLEECRTHGIEAPPPPAGTTLWEYLHLKDTAFWSPRNHAVSPVFILDQFEEVFTLGRAEPRRAREFLVALGNLINNEIPAELQERLNADPEQAASYAFRRTDYRIVLSLREDFLPELEHQLRNIVRAPTQSSVRLKRMSGQQALDGLVATGGHLLAPDVAPRIIRFLAARSERDADGDAPLSDLEVEPALLSVFARELNERRKRQGLELIEPELLKGSQGEIFSDFYEASFAGLDPGVRVFVEEELLTESGFRDSYAVEDAVARPGVTLAAIDSLIDQRLLRREERLGTQRVELTHDVLTKIVQASRDERRREEDEAERAAREAAERQRMRRRTRQLAMVAAVFVLLGIGSLAVARDAVEARGRAVAALEEAEAARAQSEEQAELARQAERRAAMSGEQAREEEQKAAAERDIAFQERERAEAAMREAEAERRIASAARESLEDILDRPLLLSHLGLGEGEPRAAQLEAANRRLALGNPVNASLAFDRFNFQGRPDAVWVYEGSAGEVIQIDLRSQDFDAHLSLFNGASGELISSNDDSEGRNSRIMARLPEDGPYVLVASTYSEVDDKERQLRYEMAVSAGSIHDLDVRPERIADLASAGADVSADARPVLRDSTVRGELDESSPRYGSRHYGMWVYQGQEGEFVRIDHQSEDFDAYLYLFDLETGELIDTSDDSDGTDSRIQTRLPRTGSYLIVPSTFRSDTEGQYELAVSEGSEEPLLYNYERPTGLADLGIAGPGLPPGARPIGRNAIVEAAFGPDSPVYGDRHYGLWAYTGQADEIVRIDHRSDDFDAYLFLFDLETGEMVGYDDDTQGTDSRIEARLPRTGTYLIVPSTFSSGIEGSYQLEVGEGSEEMVDVEPARPQRLADLGITGPESPPGASTIDGDTAVQGVLDGSSSRYGGRLYHVWAYQGLADDEVQIDLRGEDFDAYLYLFDLETGDLVASNDDSEGTNPRIEARLPRTGTYLIVPSTYGTNVEGRYELEVRDGPRSTPRPESYITALLPARK